MKTLIIVPYRNRSEHKRIFLENFKDTHHIVFVEQEQGTPFNRAKLFNIGYDYFVKVQRLQDYYDYLIFHDVDLIPEFDYKEYYCNYVGNNQAIHYSTYVSQFDYKEKTGVFGGVSGVPIWIFEDINGFSNEFWSWGGEDDDIRNRLFRKGHAIHEGGFRYSSLSHMPNHSSDIENYKRNWNLLNSDDDSKYKSGLVDLDYEVLKCESFGYYTELLVNTKYNPLKNISCEFFTTSNGPSDYLEVSKDCIKKFYPNYNHNFICGKSEPLYPNKWFEWLNIANIKKPDYAIHVDEDCFILDENVVKKLLSKMELEGIDVLGVRDGNSPMRRQNPYAMNTYFLILSKRAYEDAANRIFNYRDSEDLRLLNFGSVKDLFESYCGYNPTEASNTLEMDFGTFRIDLNNNFEGYYPLFWFLKKNGYKLEYLESFQEPELNCSFLYNSIVHAWYSRSRNQEIIYEGLTLPNRTRYDLILKHIRENYL